MLINKLKVIIRYLNIYYFDKLDFLIDKIDKILIFFTLKYLIMNLI